MSASSAEVPTAAPIDQGRDSNPRLRLTLTLVAVLLVALWVYAILRADRLAFTNDEAISYGILHGETTFVDTANNQWLNTWLMWVSQHLFGESELALRLPNVASFPIYGIAIVALLSYVRHFASRIVGLSVLVLNPFLMEFFALARGYGLSMAFLAAALACSFYRRSQASGNRELARIALLGIFALAAFYANFSALNVVMAIYSLEIVDLLLARPRRAGVRRITVMGFAAAGLVPGIIQLHHLQIINQLYYGGHNGFISSTVGSLLGASSCGYGCEPSWLTAGEVAVVAAATLAIMWSVGHGIRARAWTNAQRAALLSVVSVLAVLVEATMLGTLYPIDRTALSYLLCFGVLLMFAIDDFASALRSRAGRHLLIPVAMCCFTVVGMNFADDANLTETTIWAYDASARQVIDAVRAFERRHGPPDSPWRLIAGFPRNESLNYYRLRFKLSWLQPVMREPVSTVGDLYDVGIEELSLLPRGTVLLASFPLTGTQLRVASRIYQEATTR